jgi:hypothetical protein
VPRRLRAMPKGSFGYVFPGPATILMIVGT